MARLTPGPPMGAAVLDSKVSPRFSDIDFCFEMQLCKDFDLSSSLLEFSEDPGLVADVFYSSDRFAKMLVGLRCPCAEG